MTQPTPTTEQPKLRVFSREEALRAWREKARGTAAVHMRYGTREYLKEIGREIEEDPTPCIPAPWPSLNWALGGRGLPCGYTHILSGPSGFGKSREGVQFVGHASSLGYQTAVISSEMGARENFARILAQRTGVSIDHLDPFSSEYDRKMWDFAVDRYCDGDPAPIWANHEASAIKTLEDALAAVYFVTEHGGAQLVMVDYAQHFYVPGAKSKKEEVDTVAREMDTIAKEQGVCILLLSQLNRQSYQNGNVPTETDQEYSHGLTKDARSVIILDPTCTEEGGGSTLYRAKLDKNRGGRKPAICVEMSHRHIQSRERPDLKWGGADDGWIPRDTNREPQPWSGTETQPELE